MKMIRLRSIISHKDLFRPAGTAVLFVIFFSLAMALSAQETPVLDVETLRDRITNEAPGELINLDIGDSSVSLRLSGRWKGTLQASLGFSLTPFGAAALFGDTPFFAQEGDITLSLWIRDRWFVEANFMDNSSLNTYRAGYQGTEGEVIRYIGFGNTGLDYPSFPYLDLGGDTPSSFGAYGNFAVGNFSLHSLIRYDAAAREERVFIGSRERSFSYAKLSRPQRGISFVLPDDNLESIPEVYIEDSKGPLLDSEGRRWRLAETSEYGANARYGLVELTLGNYTGGASEPEAMIAVAYNKVNSTPWRNSLMGGYASSDFLVKVKDWLQYDLESLPQCGGYTPISGIAGMPGETEIINTNTPILVIYEPGTFSPFEKQNRYDAPLNISSDAALIKISSGETIPDYEVIPLENFFPMTTMENQEEVKTTRGVYELIKTGPRESRSPKERWPLGESIPQLYLPGRPLFVEDMAIRFTNYGAMGAYSIGTDVVPGSVQVYRNGILDPNFHFSPSGGTVSLANPAGFSEVIRITYLKQSIERRLGSLAAGIGVIWDSGGSFNWKLGLGLRWNVSSDDYSENGASSPGSVGLGAEVKWDYEKLKAGIALGFGFEQPDTTGIYRAAGMEGNEMLLPVPLASSFLSGAPNSYGLTERSDLVFRKIIDNTLSSSSQVLSAEFDFSPGETWTGVVVPLGLNGEYLERAGKIEILYRFINLDADDPSQTITLNLQIGALADKDSHNVENPELQINIPLHSGPVNLTTNDPGIITYTLTDQDRLKLGSAKYFRLLIERSSVSGNLNGRVILAPPLIQGALWRPVTVAHNNITSNTGLTGPQVSAYEEKDSTLENKYTNTIKRLHMGSSLQRVLNIAWDDFSDSDSGPGADTRIPVIPLANYRSLSFFVRRPAAIRSPLDTETEFMDKQDRLDEGTLRFLIARGPDSLKTTGEIVLEAVIPLADFKSLENGEWVRIDIQYQDGNPVIHLDGKPGSGPPPKYNSSALRAFSQSSAAGGNMFTGTDTVTDSMYAAFLIIPGINPLPKGNMAFDEIILEDSVPSYRLNNGASLEWNHSGAILAIREKVLVSDFSFSSAIETGVQGNPFEGRSDGSFGMNGRSQAGISVFGASISGNFSYSLSSYSGKYTDYFWSAGHSLSRTFGPFSISGYFNDAPSDRLMNHGLSFVLNTKVSGSLSGEAVQQDERLNRRWLAGAGGSPAEKIPLDFFINASMGISEKIGNSGHKLSNYALDWIKSFGYLIPDSGAGAEGRDLRGNLRLRLNTSPLGTELYFQGLSSFSSPGNISGSGSLLRLDFPLNFADSGIRMLFRNEREYRRDLFGTSRHFLHDAELWGENFALSLPLLFSIPLYSLFDPRMDRKMHKFASLSSHSMDGDSFPELSRFSDRVEFSLQRAMNYGLSSLFVPNRFTFRLSRVLEQKLDIPSDTLGIGAVLGFSSINMFGAMGTAPLFKFYQGDEFNHSIETQISIPKTENVFWTLRANQALAFYGFSGAELSVDNALTINSSNRYGENGRWSDSLAVSWTSPMERTLLGNIYASFARMADRQSGWLTLSNLTKSEYELVRRESLEFVIEKSSDSYYGDYVRFSISLGHESIVRIFGKLNLSVFGKIALSEDTGSKILSFIGTVGTSLFISF